MPLIRNSPPEKQTVIFFVCFLLFPKETIKTFLRLMKNGLRKKKKKKQKKKKTVLFKLKDHIDPTN